LITGAARGIGRGIAKVFGENGAHVVVGDIKDKDAEEVVRAAEGQHGKKGLAVHLDVTDPVGIKDAVAQTIAEFGRIDVLVNNAGLMRNHYIIDFPLADWQAVFKVNMEGTFLCSQAVAKEMIENNRTGCIINISSCAANKADLKHSAYSASKAAIITFTRVAALELGQYGIRVNAILPGATGPTDMLQAVFQNVPGIEQELISKTTLGKLATPEDQGNAALFLASDLASHITGEYLIVAGGEFMNA
jgi:NAD(P)-dependent dehydrogenase (short-subunit alcohol dehydrogenase family)